MPGGGGDILVPEVSTKLHVMILLFRLVYWSEEQATSGQK
jgi:hypothetical protein